MSDALEVFKIVGSLGGLISAGFLVYDRVFRVRPLAYLEVNEKELQVVVRNVSEETLIIDEVEVSPNVLGLAKGNDLRSTVEVALQRRDELSGHRLCFVVLKPLQQFGFGIVSFEAFEKMSDAQTVSMRLSWRTTRYVFPFKRNIWVKTTAGDIRKFRKET